MGAAFRSPRSTEGHNTALRQGAVRPSREREGLGGRPAPAGKNAHSCLHTHAHMHTRVHTHARSHRFHSCAVRERDLLRPSHPAFQPRAPLQNGSVRAADPSLQSEAQQLARCPPLAGPPDIWTHRSAHAHITHPAAKRAVLCA